MSKASINLAELSRKLAATPDTTLRFSVDGTMISNGYHVTEIKHADIKSIDCGQGSDSWREVIIQILDGSLKSDKQAMNSAKFLRIISAAAEKVNTDTDAHLYFECAPNNNTLQRLQVQDVTTELDTTTVLLKGANAECKPFARVLSSAGTSATSSSCCSPRAATSSCCGSSDKSKDSARSCC